MVNLLLVQMQVMDFIVRLKLELAIITNETNLTDLNEAEETAKNIENASFINKMSLQQLSL